ncbi:hypothetical protein [Pseudodesulfovibrio sp.]|uniref:hypothetical protein n=1 Tax=unclassified Pseudodesulfovibrio TaxID=2661612 RepID=UPI003B00285E
MYELVIEHRGVKTPVFTHEDPRVVELMRQRHARSLTPGEATIHEISEKKETK